MAQNDGLFSNIAALIYLNHTSFNANVMLSLCYFLGMRFSSSVDDFLMIARTNASRSISCQPTPCCKGFEALAKRFFAMNWQLKRWCSHQNTSIIINNNNMAQNDGLFSGIATLDLRPSTFNK
jgi:hypothetical protein